MKIVINGEEIEIGGKDATINGQNTLEIVAGNNVIIEQEGGTLTISATDGEVYSTEETRIGTWIDGKPLYRKVLNLTSPATINHATLIYSMLDIMPTNLYGFLTDEHESKSTINAYHGGTNYIAVWYIPTIGIYAQVNHTASSSYFTNKPMTIVVEYTKTTDQAIIQLDTQPLQTPANMSASAVIPETTGYIEEDIV